MTIALVALATLAVAAVIMLVIANLSSGERKIAYRIASLHSVEEPTVERAMSSLLGPRIVGENRITSLLNGDQIFPPMLAAVRAAKKTITIARFWWRSRPLREKIVEGLAGLLRAQV